MEVERADPEPENNSDPLLGHSPCCSCLSGDFQSNHGQEPRWWVRAILKIREWSEIVAGPRWKTFIRRINGHRRRRRVWHDSAKYDPLSYKLNFEDEEEEDDKAGFRSFSMRYASVPVVSGKAPALK
ncbi:hypothetical protein EUTSA_v10010820mg [Eutrema salsugineum]|uniref:Uncharacterized protein n=1 Tax=Eutrema salsugineum TaxID=72664 RepID=V4LPN7_EUTSA|nr:uncharacterized protein LOC18021046 [Eutrema salsugineum]ESQ45759.1 hypothetical protein EUTSA_v10010820mg [Eutrema salsugineum]